MKSTLLRTAAIAAVASWFSAPAAADGPRDAMIQSPTFKQPERGSVAGGLASLSFGAADVSRGAYSLPLPVALPSERGGILAQVIPTYAPDGGASEWGIGWSTNLTIQRFRLTGDVDYETDQFTSPWGRLVEGNDGNWYPTGLSSPVRVQRVGAGWRAIGPDGTRYDFTRTVDTDEGTYAWYLTRAETIFGDATEIEYVANASGRPFVHRVYYGGREDTRTYRLDLQYETLQRPLFDYRSGQRLDLDRRVIGVVAFVKEYGRGAYKQRWRYDIGYVDSAFGPGFYLESVMRTFASGEAEPPVTYDYERPEQAAGQSVAFAAGPFEEAPHLAQYLEQVYDIDGFQPERVATTDIDEDGLPDLEHAWDFSLYRQTAAGEWRLEPAPLPTGPVDTLCRPGDSVENGPRTLVRLQGAGGPLQVLVLEAFWDITEIHVCDRAGVLRHSALVPGSWVLGANTKIVDLNRDDKPDLLWVDSGEYRVLENISGEGCAAGPASCQPVGFREVASGTLSFEHGTPFDPTATWAQDINGDGNPDLILRTTDRISIWYGRGRFRFDETEHSFVFRNLRGDEVYNLDDFEITWLDANKDGLADALLTFFAEITLFINEGDHFQEVAVPSFAEAERLGWAAGAPVIGDLRARGETEVAFPSFDGTFAVALTNPATGLLTRADDGKGTVVTFRYKRADAAPGIRQRPSVLSAVTVASGGYDAVTSDYRYAEPRMHGIGHFLVGFGRTEQVGPVTAETVTFHNDDDIAGLALSSRSYDGRTPHLVKLSSTQYEGAAFAGVRLLRPRKVTQGWCSEDSVERCTSGAATSVMQAVETPQYAKGVCPVLSVSSTQHGTVTQFTQLSAPVELATALHCVSAGETWRGAHADASLDFQLATSIQRNRYGQPELIRQLGAESMVLQEIAYHPSTHRLAWLRSPATGTQTFTFDATTGLMAQTSGADGVVTSVAARDPISDAIRELGSDRGLGGRATSSFRFDGMERLSRVWSDFGGSSSANPLQAITYEYPTDQYPGLIRTVELVDARLRTFKYAAELQYPDGATLATAVRHPRNWVFSGVSVQVRNDLRSSSYRKSPLPPNVDLGTKTYGELRGQTTQLAETRAAGFGQEVGGWSHLQSGVTRETAQTIEIGGNALISTSIENGALQTRAATDASGLVLWAEDQSGVPTQYRRRSPQIRPLAIG